MYVLKIGKTPRNSKHQNNKIFFLEIKSNICYLQVRTDCSHAFMYVIVVDVDANDAIYISNKCDSTLQTLKVRDLQGNVFAVVSKTCTK